MREVYRAISTVEKMTIEAVELAQAQGITPNDPLEVLSYAVSFARQFSFGRTESQLLQLFREDVKFTLSLRRRAAKAQLRSV